MFAETKTLQNEDTNYFINLFYLVSISCKKNSVPEQVVQRNSQKEEMVGNTKAFPRIVFGTRSHPCGGGSGCDCTGYRGICLIIEPRIFAGGLGTNEGVVELEVLSADKMKIRIIDEDNPSREPLFHIFGDYSLKQIKDYLGGDYTIKKGDYAVDYSNSSLGEIIVDIY